MWYKNWYRLTNSFCTASQTFSINYLTNQSSTFEISIKKNEKYSRFKTFRWFRGFALHYESAESAESWENFVLLLDKRLDYFLIEWKLVPNLQNSRKFD